MRTIYKPISPSEVKHGQVLRHTLAELTFSVITEGTVHSVGNRRKFLIGDADRYVEIEAEAGALEVQHELPEDHGTLVLLDREIGSAWASRTADNWVNQDGNIVDDADLIAQFVRVLWSPKP